MKKIIFMITIMATLFCNIAFANEQVASYISTYGSPYTEVKGNGTVEVIEENENVTIIGGRIMVEVMPDKGYKVGQFVIVNSKGEEIKITAKNDYEYYFYCPNDYVFIYVNFVLDGETANNLWFADVKSTEWYYGYVYGVAEREIMTGASAYIFNPNSKMTRAMMWTVLYRYADNSKSTSGVEWYKNAKNWVVENNYSDGQNYESDITRQEVATILYRYAQSPSVATNYISGYTDGSSVASWAKDAMNWAVSKGIITGNTKGELQPTEFASRAEVATIFMRFIAE